MIPLFKSRYQNSNQLPPGYPAPGIGAHGLMATWSQVYSQMIPLFKSRYQNSIQGPRPDGNVIPTLFLNDPTFEIKIPKLESAPTRVPSPGIGAHGLMATWSQVYSQMIPLFKSRYQNSIQGPRPDGNVIPTLFLNDPTFEIKIPKLESAPTRVPSPGIGAHGLMATWSQVYS